MSTSQTRKNLPSVLQEMSLWDFLSQFGKQKKLIFGTTFICCLISFLLSFGIKPIYQAEARVSMPLTSDFNALNVGRSKAGTPLKPLSAKQVYKIFLDRLSSHAVRHKFCNSPGFLNTALNDKQKEADIKQFFRTLTFTLESPKTKRYRVMLQAKSSADLVQKRLRAFIAFAHEEAKQSALKRINNENKEHAKYLALKMAIQKQIVNQKRADRIVQLKEALNIAKASGIEVLASQSDLQGEALYLRGAKVLTEEIKSLEGRKDDKAYIAKLPELEAEHRFYAELKLSPHFKMYRSDGSLSSEALPNRTKTLILFMGLIGGLLLGITIAMIRQFYSKEGIFA